MKTLIAIISSVLLLVGVAQAQDTMRTRTMDKTRTQMRDRVHREDHVMMMDGKLYQMKQGTRTEVQKPVKLMDGTMLNPDGSYEKGGKKYQLANGECMDMNGFLYKNKMMFNKRKMMDAGGMQKNKMQQKKQGNKPSN